MEMRGQALLRTILLNTGNHVVQKTNPGGRVNKTKMIDSIIGRVSDDEVREKARDHSEVTGK